MTQNSTELAVWAREWPINTNMVEDEGKRFVVWKPCLWVIEQTSHHDEDGHIAESRGSILLLLCLVQLFHLLTLQGMSFATTTPPREKTQRKLQREVVEYDWKTYQDIVNFPPVTKAILCRGSRCFHFPRLYEATCLGKVEPKVHKTQSHGVLEQQNKTMLNKCAQERAPQFATSADHLSGFCAASQDPILGEEHWHFGLFRRYQLVERCSHLCTQAKDRARERP